MKLYKPLDAGLLANASTGFQQDIKSFLAKPYPFAKGFLRSSDTSGTHPLYTVFNTMTSIDMFASKVKGYLGIRADAVLRFQINGERFMQGRYMLCFAPLMVDGATGYLNSGHRLKQARANRHTVTQLPHVEVDLNTDTEGILRIPYVSPYTHYDLLEKTGDVGTFFIYPYVPLATGASGSQQCRYTLWISFENIDLVAPTITPQMAGGIGRTRPVASVRKKGSNPSELEQGEYAAGGLSGVLARVSRAADVVSQVPSLTALAGTVSWAADIASQTATSFGWSRPTDLAPPTRTYLAPNSFWNNSDAMDFSQPLAMTSRAKVEVLPGFAGTDADECSIDFLKTKPSFVYRGDMNTSHQAGLKLMSFGLCPALFSSVYNDGHRDYTQHSPLSFLATMFRRYRGSIRLTFKIVKTEFHSGRLCVSYAPSKKALAEWNIEQSSYMHREIIDFRSGTEFSLVFPFASTTSYLDVDKQYGQVQVNVLNELVAPDSVSQSVSILVEASAAPDMEFAFPISPHLTNYAPFTIQSAPLDFQGDFDDGRIVDEIIADGAMYDDHLANSRYSNGEKILSVSQFIKRFCRIGLVPDKWQTGFRFDFWSMAPFSISTTYSNADKSLTHDTIRHDWYSILVPMYAMSRGGVRYKIVAVDSNGLPLSRVSMYPMLPGGVLANSVANSISAKPGSIEINKTLGLVGNFRAGPLEFEVPHYGHCHSRVNWESMNGVSVSNLTVPDTIVEFKHTKFNEDGGDFMLRGVADDFQLGYFVGIPPMLTTDFPSL